MAGRNSPVIKAAYSCLRPGAASQARTNLICAMLPPILRRALGLHLKAGINVGRSSALRRIAGNIYKTTLLPAFRADIRRVRRGYGETALGTFPVCQAALGANISLEPTIS